MPEFEPVTEVVHRTDASVVALPWPAISRELASESYYRVGFRQQVSHQSMDILVFTIQKGEKDYRLATAFEVFDVAFYGKHKTTRKPTCFFMNEDPVPFQSLAEAQTAAKVEAVLHHAHTKGYRRV
jgi:hypothetical protein